MKFRFAVVLAVSLLLGGCFHSSDEPAGTEQGTHLYATEEFRLEIPNEWEILTSKDFTSAISPGTLVAFRSPIRNTRFTANVVIIKNDLSAEISSLDYSKLLRQRLSQDISGYAPVAQEEVQITVAGASAPTLIVRSKGSESPEADIKLFIHKAGIKGAAAFVVAGAYLPDEQENVISAIENMVGSFEIK